MFGLVDSLANGGQALGGVVAPVLVATLGLDAALVVTGLTLPIAAVVLWPGLRAADPGVQASDRRIELIGGIQLFAPLSLAAVEDLASRLRPVTYAPDAWLIREGDQGDEFLIIDDGRIEVSQAGATIREMGPGSGVGEIALLYDVPRTASVRAIEEVRAFGLGRTDFLQAVASEATVGG
ncbi:MAG: cyclic nucleotide-binding domain-containing protein [Candidatus Limnocylindria bacterium]